MSVVHECVVCVFLCGCASHDVLLGQDLVLCLRVRAMRATPQTQASVQGPRSYVFLRPSRLVLAQIPRSGYVHHRVEILTAIRQEGPRAF